MKNEFTEMEKNIDSISISVIKPLEMALRNYLDKCGLFYKVFSRIKSSKSVHSSKSACPRQKSINFIKVL